MDSKSFDWNLIEVHADYRFGFVQFQTHGVNYIDESGYNALGLYLFCATYLNPEVLR